ncbi:DUF4336 domain-containing protein [Calothrix sp. CCY 0018]|uniref:DUF4336 domain-containing protein n=1 Tax=Calothrix sp. CCY 0018 TaxID=3103864 RepID=UPI0039C6DAF1
MLETLQQNNSKDYSWNFWFTLPIYPFGKRRTIRKEVVKDTVWTFDQLQGIFYVVVPIRMTVVKLNEGGLLVYAPIAPTPECVRLVEELVAEYGRVKYIILPTISGLEHKVFVGPFARRFPDSQIFVAPKQWSFPVNLPLSWLGIPAKRTQVLPEDSSKTPFGNQFDYEILGPIELRAGRFAEVALLHKSSNTLLVTDSIVSVPEQPPAITLLDTYPLLFHARDKATDIIADTPENRHKGWQRIALFGLYFRPSVLDVPKWGEVFRNAAQAPQRSNKAYFGLYPFQWKQDWQRCFETLRGDGRLFVAPILQTLILNRAPEETIAWADKIAKWDFKRIIPCHFDAPIEATPKQFRQAFSFLEKHSNSTLPQEDFQLLEKIDATLDKLGIPSAKEKV